MGIISEITSGMVKVFTGITMNDSDMSIWMKSHFEKEGQGSKSENGEHFNIDGEKVQLNDKDIEVQVANEQKFLQIDSNIHETQIDGLLKCINNLPDGFCDALIKDGWEIRMVDMTPREFTIAYGYGNRTDDIAGITNPVEKYIEIPNLYSINDSVESLLSQTQSVIGHEIGHVIDKTFGMLSNTSEWTDAFNSEKQDFIRLDARDFTAGIGVSVSSFFQTYKEEAFAETISKYLMDGDKFGSTFDTMLTPQMCQYISNMFEAIGNYLDESKGISFNDFFSELNPNTNMETHNYNETEHDENVPNYKTF